MSGFELERQSLSDKLTHVAEVTEKFTGEDLNRGLLTTLQQSSDIVKDLWSLYADRPYVYARIMQQLGKVMGKAQLRKIHNAVIARSKAAAQAQEQLSQLQKPALRSAKDGSEASGAPASLKKSKDDKSAEGEKEDEGEKEFNVNVPALGIHNVKVSLSKAEGSQRISASDLPIPVLESLSGTVTYGDKKVKKIEVSGNLKAALLESEGQVRFSLEREGESSKYTPTLHVQNVKLKVPGLDDVTVGLSAGEDKLQGELSGAGKLLNNVEVQAMGTVTTTGSDTALNGTLTVLGGAANREAAGASAKSSSGSGMTYSGSITLDAASGAITGASGTLSLGNIHKLADPNGTVDLEVAYEGSNFTAKLTNAVALAEHSFTGGETEGGENATKGGGKEAKPTTVQLTINEASYDGAFSGNCTLTAKLGGLITATGTVNIANNSVTDGQISIQTEEVPVIGEKAFVKASLSGDISVNDAGFSGTAEGVAQFRVGKQTVEVNLDSASFDSSGQFSGKISLAKPVEVKSLKFETLVADFSSTEGLSNVDGKLSIDMPRIKSDEKGIQISLDGDVLKGSGTLKLLGAGGGADSEGGAVGGEGGDAGNEMATCDFEATLSPDSLSGKGTFTVTKDYQVGSTKLRILAGSTAVVELTDSDIAPIKFNGTYDYGHASGEAGGAEAGTQKASGNAATAASAKDGSESVPLQFSGEFNECSYDVNSGALNGAATAKLESDIKYSSALMDVQIDASRRGKDTEFQVQIANSSVETISGTMTYEADIPIKGGAGNGKTLYVEGTATKFSISVPDETFSGNIKNSLRKDFQLIEETEAGNSLKLNGNQATSLTCEVDSNTITSITFDGEAEAKLTNPMFEEGSEKFSFKLKDASVNKDTMAITTEKASITPKTPVKLILGEKKDTKLTFEKDSSLSAVIKDSLVQSITASAGFEGETGIFKTSTPLKFKGTSSVTVDDIQGAGKVDGNLEVQTSHDCTLDEIEDTDEITLVQGSKFGLVVSHNQIDSVTGSFELDYEIKPGAVSIMPNGMAVRVTGEELSYTVDPGEFNGKVGVGPKGDIEFKPAGAKEGGVDGSFTITGKNSALNGNIEKNKLKTISGSVGFKAEASLDGAENGASVKFTDGVANVGIDLVTNEIQDMNVSSKVDIQAKVGNVTITSDAGEAEGVFDESGLKQACFKGSINIEIERGTGGNSDGDEKIVLKVGTGSGINYTREEGFSGAVVLECVNDVNLGHLKGKDGSAGGYKYGLKGGAEGGSSITAEINKDGIESLSGNVGLFLREEGGEKDENLLQVDGNITFEYDAKSGGLKSASGAAIVKEKELCKIGKTGDSLKLKESSVEIEILNDSLQGITGTVNLALADAESEYMAFKSGVDFDCTQMNEINASVEGHFTRDKKVGEGKDGIAFYVTGDAKGGATAFSCEIAHNEIQSLTGAFGVRVKKGNTDLFEGGISDGSYSKEEGTFSGTGEIKLLSDLNIPNDSNPVFALKSGSGGKATLEKGEINDVEGTIIVGLKAPKVNGKSSDSELVVESSAKINVKEQVLNNFKGTASLQGGKFPISDGLSLTNLSGSVSIDDNTVGEITGSAGVEYKKGNFELSGNCDLGWQKGTDGSEDKISLNGGLSVTAFDGRLHGEANIKYDSAGPVLEANGKLDFELTKWLVASVELNFPNNSWDNPTIKGRLEAKNVELVAGRTLMAFGKDFGIPVSVMAGPVPVKFEAGVGLGASIDLLPVCIDAAADIGPFELNDLKSGALPKFEVDINAKSGLKLNASVAPYVSAAIGTTGFEAGIRVRGKAEVSTTAEANIGGKLRGGEDGFNGEIDLGFGVSADASLKISPELYAQVLTFNPTLKLTEFDFDLGNVFKFEWGKKFTFGDKGQDAVDSGNKTDMDGGSVSQETVETTKGEEAKYTSKEGEGASGGEKDKPNIPTAGEIGKDSMGKQVGDSSDGLGDIGQTMQDLSDVAAGAAAIGDFVSLVSGLISSFAAGGPIGVVGYLAVQIITGKLSFSLLKEKISAIKDGVAAIKRLYNSDVLQQFLPKQLLEIKEFFETAKEEGLLNLVVEAVENKVNSMSSPYNRILAPIVSYLKGRRDSLAKLAESMFVEKLSFEGIIKIAANLVGFALGSALDLLRMVGEIGSIVKTIVQECIASGDIFVTYTEKKVWWGTSKEYKWQVKIPGLCNFSGDGAIVSNLLGMFGIKAKKQK